jgi:hypothetical protein
VALAGRRCLGPSSGRVLQPLSRLLTYFQIHLLSVLRGTEITRPNQVWAMDITYIPMARGFVYLAVVLDWATRRVLSWRLSITMEAAFCVETLEGTPCHSAWQLNPGRCSTYRRGDSVQTIGTSSYSTLLRQVIASYSGTSIIFTLGLWPGHSVSNGKNALFPSSHSM